MSMSTTLMNTTDYLANDDMFSRMTRFSEMMAGGLATVPQHLRGNPADCMAIVMQASQWGMNPFSVAQKTHLVNGVLGYEAQLVNSVINAMAPTKDRLHFEYFGQWENVIGKFKELKSQKGKSYLAPNWTYADEQGCGIRVFATLKGEDEPRVLELLLTQAQVRNSTLWASDPKQQLAYLGIKRWSRLYCPDVIMGVYTPDEVVDGVPERDVTPERKVAGKTSAVTMALNKGKKPKKEVIEVVESELFSRYKANIQSCCDINELNEVSGALSKDGELDVSEINSLRAIYSEHKKAINA